jgi:flagellin
MSFRINTNTTAMNALSNLNNSADSLNQSIQRLSTGLKINSASDNPAGLIVSEGYKAQLTGMNQAIQNSQDAMNYTKTAEGALSEVNNLLNDARGLAVAAGNTGTLSSSAVQANQSQLQSIVGSITRIAQTTSFGTKKLLDGSSGVNAAVTDGAKVASINIGGQVGTSTAVTSNGSVAITVTQAATQAVVASKSFGADDTVAVGTAGGFTLNGVSFTAAATDTVAQTAAKINAASSQTGVIAVTNNTGTITLQSVAYGSQARIDLTDSSGVLKAAAGYTTNSGVAAEAQVSVSGGATALFTGSQGAADGLTLSDASGNSIRLNQAGNATSVTNATIGQVVVGNAQFQIGGNAGQTTSLSLGNFAASNLGSGAVTGLNLSNLDLTTASGATNALQVIDAAISQVATSRGNIGSFQTNVLQANITSLTSAQQNLSATESSIADTDIAAEMTNFTKQQILQSAGLSVLAQANQAPQSVLKLLG